LRRRLNLTRMLRCLMAI